MGRLLQQVKARAQRQKQEKMKRKKKQAHRLLPKRRKVVLIRWDYRMYHLLAIDLKAYNDAKTALSKLINEYCSVVDNVEKNYEKLTAPKGSSGGNNHMGMF